MAMADARPGLDPNLTREAFRKVVSDPANTDLLRGVRYAFEYRRSFPNRPEAKLGGLGIALSQELATFDLGSEATPDEHRWASLNSSFRGRLRRAGEYLARDPSATAGYVHRLEFIGEDVSEVTVDRLQRDIIQALTNYSADPRAGNDVGPW